MLPQHHTFPIRRSSESETGALAPQGCIVLPVQIPIEVDRQDKVARRRSKLCRSIVMQLYLLGEFQATNGILTQSKDLL
jgi:hypothetical protein